MDFKKRTSEQLNTAHQGANPAPVKGTAMATTLGEDTEFTGTMKFGDSLRIEGKFQGDLASSGHLYVGGAGQVRAEIKVNSLTVEGKVTGNIHAEKLVDLRNAAEVFGDVTAEKIKIEDGVVFVGKAKIQPPQSKSQPLPNDLIKQEPQLAEKKAVPQKAVSAPK